MAAAVRFEEHDRILYMHAKRDYGSSANREVFKSATIAPDMPINLKMQSKNVSQSVTCVFYAFVWAAHNLIERRR